MATLLGGVWHPRLAGNTREGVSVAISSRTDAEIDGHPRETVVIDLKYEYG